MQLHLENMTKLHQCLYLVIAEDIQNVHGSFLHNFITETTKLYEILKTDEAFFF